MMLRKINLIAALLVTFSFATPGFASVYQTVDISTGVNVGAPGNPLYANGSSDDYWRVRSVPGTSYQTSIQSRVIFMGIGWNTIPGTQPIFGNNNNVGTSEYERCFCLPSTQNAQLTLVMRADNKANLFLNSYFNPTMQAWVNNTFAYNVAPVQRTYTAQDGLKVGLNCIRVRVNNEGGPTGFALKATAQGFGVQDTAQPECCRQGAAVFTEALRTPGVNLDPLPDKEATPAPEVPPGRIDAIKRPDR